MRGLTWFAFAAVMLSFAPAARAATLAGSFDVYGFTFVDYTVPADGQEYRWDLWSDPSHPTTLITLSAPDEVFSTVKISNGNGTTSFDQTPPLPDFKWLESVMPGHTEIFLWAPADFDFCAGSPPAGTICAVDNTVWGNSAFLTVNANSNDPVRITFASTAIPEPATWSLLIGGFLTLGWALRRQRAVLQSA